MPDYVVLMMDPVGLDSAAYLAWEDSVKTVLMDVAPGTNFQFLRGTDAKDRYFEQCGSNWPAWRTFLASGVDYETRIPICNAVCTLDVRVGKATGIIMQEALAAKRMGLCLTEGRVYKVGGVTVADDTDWKAGWVLTLEGDGVDPSSVGRV